MTREELIALCERAMAIGSVKHSEFVDYIVVLEQSKRGRNGQWEKTEAAYMSVDGRVAMANEDHRRQGKALHFEDPSVMVEDDDQLTLMVAVTSEVYGRRHGIATSRKQTGTSAERNFPWETAETSAIGRALGAFGYGVLPGSGLASAEDVQRAIDGDSDGTAQAPRQREQQGQPARQEAQQPVPVGQAPAANRRARRVSPFQMQKMRELVEENWPDHDADAVLRDLFEEQVGKDVEEATYDEGRQITAYLLRLKRGQNAATG